MFYLSAAAREVGRSEAFLRKAERRGAIPVARRDHNGWRVYTEEDLAVLKQLLAPRVPPEQTPHG